MRLEESDDYTPPFYDRPSSTVPPIQHASETLKTLLDNIEEGYYEVDLEGNFTFFNRAACGVMGYSADELMGLEYTRYYDSPETARRVRDAYASVYQTGAPIPSFILPITRKDGALRTVETSIHLMRDAAGKPTGFRGITRDITERNRAEESLRRSEERFRNYFQLSIIGMTVITPDRRWSQVNDRFCQMVGYNREELSGKTFIEITHPDDVARNLEALNDAISGRIDEYTLEKRFIRKDGGIVHAQVSSRCVRDSNGAIEYFIALIQDITERIQSEELRQSLEAQVRHAQKLESLGVLAGGIAHDFNNLLMGVMGNVGLALIETAEDSPVYRYLNQIETAAMRAADLTKQMLAYSGKGTFVIQPLGLSSLIDEMGRLLTLTISKKAVLEFQLERSLPPIAADAAQLRQVVMNLVANASEALPERGGMITIRTGVVSLNREQAASVYLPKDFPAGSYVRLEVADSGVGMTEETQARIFDPFFSTKFTGRGLGLAAVQGIVRGHHGAIRVVSGVDQGSVITVYFPLMTESGGGAPGQTPVNQAFAWTGHGSILVVDDEEMVQAVTRQTLQRCGFTVLTARNGLEGLETFKKHQREIAAVILDLTMPVLSGVEAYQELIKIDPHVRVILSSGYNEQDATQPLAGARAAEFIQKPYSPTALIGKLRALLES